MIMYYTETLEKVKARKELLMYDEQQYTIEHPSRHHQITHISEGVFKRYYKRSKAEAKNQRLNDLKEKLDNCLEEAKKINNEIQKLCLMIKLKQ